MKNKKELEFNHIRSFLEIYDQDLFNKISFDNIDDKPDCIIEKIGIEHTQYLINERIPYIDHRNRFCKLIKEKLLNKNLYGIEINISFKSIEKASKYRLAEIAQDIASFIEEKLIDKKEEQFEDLIFGNTVIGFLWISPYILEDEIIVIPTNADWICDIDNKKINEIIGCKQIKLNKYKTGITELWLLIVIDSMSEAGYLEAIKDSFKEIIDNSFNRIFLFKYPERNIYKLKE